MSSVLVSVITPSYQQGRFIERTLQSVRRQGAGVEHIVMDGGSTDGTVEILERWRERISFSTGPDGGQTAAINAGMAMARGEILAYLNSDDVYRDGAVAAVGTFVHPDQTARYGVDGMDVPARLTAQFIHPFRLLASRWRRARSVTAIVALLVFSGVAGEAYAGTPAVFDFGDAPDSYHTTLAANGPQHPVLAGFSLGATVDTEANGQPDAFALGDGADEDGVTLPAGGFKACLTQPVTVTLTNSAAAPAPKLDAWIDWDGDGQFNDPRDRIATGLALVAGANVVNVSVPCDAKSVQTFTRFRLSTTGVALPTGLGADGEVEDYVWIVSGLDFGDAPDPTYPTLLASDGARHSVLAFVNPTLGTTIDTEGDGQPNTGATGDGADEDGVTFPAPLVIGAQGSITLRTGAVGGNVSCWIDLNRNGSWADAGENVVANVALGAGANQTFNFPVPLTSVAGQSYARCRISSLGFLGFSGVAADGEVEDHAVTILAAIPALGVYALIALAAMLGLIAMRRI
jgi:hypothetical protein